MKLEPYKSISILRDGQRQQRIHKNSFATPSHLRQMFKRLRNASLAMCVLLTIGTSGYFLVGNGDWPIFDCFYMSVITISTIGYGETLPLAQYNGGRPFTTMLIFTSFVVHAYFISTITAFFLSEEFENLWWRTRMERMVLKQSSHTIICGGGETGVHVIQELLDSGANLVVIDDNNERLRRLQERLGSFPVVVGDATEEVILDKAGIDRATGLVAVLPSDKDNLFITITARRMNPKLKIVSKGIALKTLDKLKRAGADEVVSPNYIGGIRIAAELTRPHVVQFLDLLTRDNELNLYIEEINLPLKSPYSGKKLCDTDIRQKDLLVLASFSPAKENWIYNPPPDHILEPLSIMIVLGKAQAVHLFKIDLQKHYPPETVESLT